MLITYRGKRYHVLAEKGYAEEVEFDDLLEYYEMVESLEDSNIPRTPSPQTKQPTILVSLVEHLVGWLDTVLIQGHDGQTPVWVCPDLDELEFWIEKIDPDKGMIGQAVYKYIEGRFTGTG